MEIKIVKSTEDFEKLSEQWNELLEKSKNQNIFLTWEWLFSWWETYSEKKELFIILLYEKNSLIGIFPGYRKKSMLKELRFLGDEYVDSCYLGQILDEKYHEKAEKELFEIIRQEGPAYLRYMKSSNCKIACNELNLPTTHIRLSVCPRIILPKNAEDYLKTLSSKTRFNIKKSERGLLQKGFYPDVKKGLDAYEAMQNIFYLNTKRWEKGQGIFSEKLKFFLLKVSKRLGKRGHLEILFLKLNDEFIAYNLNFIYNETVFVYSAAFDASKKEVYGSFSPGLYLNYINLKNSIEHGFRIFDMLRGENPYKLKLANSFTYNDAVMFSKKNDFLFRLYMKYVQCLNVASYHIESKVSEKTKSAVLKLIPKSLLRVIR